MLSTSWPQSLNNQFEASSNKERKTTSSSMARVGGTSDLRPSAAQTASQSHLQTMPMPATQAPSTENVPVVALPMRNSSLSLAS